MRAIVGSIVWRKCGWTAKLTMSDGNRYVFRIPGDIPKSDTEKAKAACAAMANIARDALPTDGHDFYVLDGNIEYGQVRTGKPIYRSAILTRSEPVGGAFESRGRFFIRITTGTRTRSSSSVLWAKNIDQARSLATRVQKLINEIRDAEPGAKASFLATVVSAAAACDDFDRFKTMAKSMKAAGHGCSWVAACCACGALSTFVDLEGASVTVRELAALARKDPGNVAKLLDGGASASTILGVGQRRTRSGA